MNLKGWGGIGEMMERRIKEKATEELAGSERALPNHHPSGGSQSSQGTCTRTKICPRMGQSGTVVSQNEIWRNSEKKKRPTQVEADAGVEG